MNLDKNSTSLPEQHCVRRGYKFVNAFDGRSYVLSARNDDYPLPNIPLRADKTLLADMLRRGEFTGKYKRKASWTYPAARPAHPMEIVRSSERFVGKLIGVEIEYYPAGAEDVSRHYNQRNQRELVGEVVGDGSLAYGGREINKLTWISQSGRLEGLLGLPIKGTVNKSCGLHIHIDARHLGKDGLLEAGATYDRLVTFYNMLKHLVPKSRLNPHRSSPGWYCKFRSNRHLRGHSARYAAINFLSYHKHQTIEFRCQGGTTNKVKIETWALLCQFLVNYAANPANRFPSGRWSWNKFVAIIPEPLRSWVILRKEKLEGVSFSPRVCEALGVAEIE